MAIVSLRYKQSQADHTWFIKYFITSKLTLPLIYVNDIIIAWDDEIKKLALKEKLKAQFDMKNLGKLTKKWTNQIQPVCEYNESIPTSFPSSGI